MRISIAILLALSFGSKFVFCADRVRQIQEEHRRLLDAIDGFVIVASNQVEDGGSGPEEEVDSDEEDRVEAARFIAGLRVQIKAESDRIIKKN